MWIGPETATSTSKSKHALSLQPSSLAIQLSGRRTTQRPRVFERLGFVILATTLVGSTIALALIAGRLGLGAVA